MKRRCILSLYLYLWHNVTYFNVCGIYVRNNYYVQFIITWILMQTISRICNIRYMISLDMCQRNILTHVSIYIYFKQQSVVWITWAKSDFSPYVSLSLFSFFLLINCKNQRYLFLYKLPTTGFELRTLVQLLQTNCSSQKCLNMAYKVVGSVDWNCEASCFTCN